MVDGRLRAQWEQASFLMAATYNAQPGRKTAVRPSKLNPFRGLLAREDDGVTDLHDVFGLNDD
ncbi:MAG: hypothetical protein ACK5Q5_18995 [Planctomycetaceae bacterium]